MAKGALGVICEQEPEDEAIPYVLVKDSFKALLSLASFYRDQLDIEIVAITGSVGKTTTKEFIASVLSKKYKVLKTAGNHNNLVGLPLTMFRMTEEDEIAVLEMGINQFGEMEQLAGAARPEVAVMTNIGECHLEFLGSLEGVLEAKSKMLDYLHVDGTLVSNGDDRMLLQIPEPRAKNRIHFGLHKENNVTVSDVEDQGLLGTNCVIHGKKADYKVHIPLPGQHMIYNALAAASVGELYDLRPDQIIDGIEHVVTVGSRNHIIVNEKYTIIDDCYNANPVSMRSAIDLLAMANTRTVAILGDMGELGSDAISLHENVGIYAKEKHIDLLVFVGEMMKKAADAAKNSGIEDGKEVLYFEDKNNLFMQLEYILKDGDTILVKASNAAGFSEIVERLN
jgi:UDP-N-acetylmuramoyl-tripeptide--D-alanyl-D-alanine ligase